MNADTHRLQQVLLRQGWWMMVAMGLCWSACEGCAQAAAPLPAVVNAGEKFDGGGNHASTMDGGVSSAPSTDGGVTSGRTLEIVPANGQLEATVGGTETFVFEAYLVDDSGRREPAQNAFWASLHPEIGRFTAPGVFEPTRERAGRARIRARAAGIEATAEVTVWLREQQQNEGVTDEDFSGPMGNASGPLVLYPADEVVIPGNLGPILFQWEKTKPYARVTLRGSYGSFIWLGRSDRMQPDRIAWRRFLSAHIGDSFQVTVEESDGPGTERVLTELSVVVAAADMTSTVYYWAVDQGKIVRIDADSTEPVVLDIPYETGPDTGAGGADDVQCRACHALSADGQHMAFTYFGGNGPGGVVDTGALNAPILPNRTARRWNFAALSPDGSLLFANYGKRISLRSGLTGDVLNEDISGFDVAHPAYSPTGDRIAFAGQLRLNGGNASWEIDFNQSALFTATIDAATSAVGTPTMVVPDEGEALYYPSFSPDGRLLAYTKGPFSRSMVNNSSLRGEIYLAAVNENPGGNGVSRVPLLRANPQQNSYFPSFNPKSEGGYYWLAFYSRRDYGHVLRGQERPQIWVAAIDVNADPAAAMLDPSHPAFWLPGQNVDTDNLSSFFAPRPCAESGGTCDTDAACCGELLCRPEGGSFSCVPPAQACTLDGAGCTTDEDCCEGLLCGVTHQNNARSCVTPGQVCSQNGQICELDANCCAGDALCVDDGSGTTRCLTGTDLPCASAGESCAQRECCEGEGLCISDTCIVVGG